MHPLWRRLAAAPPLLGERRRPPAWRERRCSDSTIACWDGKFHYWVARPNQFVSELTTVLTTYPNPDYPSGHSTGLAATAEVLSYLFPRDEHFFQSRAVEDAASRIWAGIHFRSATEAGLQLGQDVGQAVVAWAESDGSS